MGLIAASPLIRHVEKWQIARAKSLANVGRRLRVSHHLCPDVQRAAISLTEKGVEFERRYVDLMLRRRNIRD